jgi:hypothetical protein
MKKNSPFVIVQNDRTRQTFLFLGKEFIEADKSEFEPIKVLANALRDSDDPQKFMEMVVDYWKTK